MTDDSLDDVQKDKPMTKVECLCPHGIETDIYCEKCDPPMAADVMSKPESVGTLIARLEDASKRISVYEKEIWNAAIEEAAKICDMKSYTLVVANEIRKLKK